MYGTTRKLLIGLVIVGAVGLMLELFLLEHTESVWQAIPFVILAVGLAGGVAMLAKPSRRVIRLFQLSMTLCVATGGLGLYLHYGGNVAFERELDASAGGLLLIWRSLRGATPVLAPAALMQLGLLGLVVAYRHPALDGPHPTAAREGRSTINHESRGDPRVSTP